MKVIEYLASGRPMVCSDLPVLRELVAQGETALLVDPEEADDWVAAIERLRDDLELRARLGTNGRAVHRDRFTWQARTAALLALGAGRDTT
jgi:glycosyltransferase involved in cell wall biosynthesis